jgi:hypothetical protein
MPHGHGGHSFAGRAYPGPWMWGYGYNTEPTTVVVTTQPLPANLSPSTGLLGLPTWALVAGGLLLAKLLIFK